MTSQHHEARGLGLVFEVAVPRDRIEQTDPHHLSGAGDPVGICDLGREAYHLAGFHDLLLDQQPQPFQLGDVRQLLAFSKYLEPGRPLRILGRDQGFAHETSQILGALLDRTEHLPQVAGMLLEFAFQGDQLRLVLLEGLLEGLAPLSFLFQLFAQLLQQAFLIGVGRQKGLLPFLAYRRVALLRLLCLTQQPIQMGGVLRQGQQRPAQSKQYDQCRGFHGCTSLGALTGRRSRSGAACLRAMRRPLRIDWL